MATKKVAAKAAKKVTSKRGAFSPVEKAGAVARLKNGEKIADVAAYCGVSENTIYAWKKKFGGETAEKPAEGLKDLQKWIADKSVVEVDVFEEKDLYTVAVVKNGEAIFVSSTKYPPQIKHDLYLGTASINWDLE